MPNIIELGPFTIHIYGLIIAVAVISGHFVAKKRAYLYKINKQIFDDWVLAIPLITSLVGARLYHVWDYWSVYSKNPQDIIKIQNGGLGILGAIIGGILGIYYVCKTKKINFFRALDLAAPSLALGQAIGRFGNWVNQEGFGPPANLPWKVYINLQNRPPIFIANSYFHPTFFYESALDLLIFTILVFKAKKFNRRGQIFALYLIFYSIVRFFLEFVRIDTWTVGTIKIAQVLSLIGFVLGVFILVKNPKKQ